MVKNIKSVIALLYFIMLVINCITYFFIQDTALIFGKEFDTLYVLIGFLLLETFMLSGVFGKKQGLSFCLLYIILCVVNIMFIVANWWIV